MKLQELLNKIKKEDIIKYYIDSENTRKQAADILNISPYQLDKLCKYFNLNKNIHLMYASRKQNYKDNKDEIVKKIKKTKLEKYGDENYNNSKKSKQTRLELYGDYHNNTEKAKQTNLEKYGVEYNPNSVKKSAETKLEKYGSATYNNQNKRKQTIINTYGSLDNYSESIQRKIKTTKKDRYGDDYYNNSEKAKQTNLEKYGTENVFQCQEVIDKILNTKKEKYGIASYNNIEKIKETCRDKYGYDYACMRPEARSAGSNNSKPNLEFEQLLIDNNIEYEKEFAIGNKSYDFRVGNNLIEINPAATHNSTWGIHGKPKDKDYHKDKSILAKENGYRCIHVWDWDNINGIINLLKPRDIIYGRNCTIKEVSKEESIYFINKYHIQGYAKDSLQIGLYYRDELVSIMTFDKPRYNKNYDLELIRYCSKYNILGGAEKLFNYFKRLNNSKSIISYCDLSKFNGDTYLRLGFKLKSSRISKHWYNIKTKRHITDNLLRQRGYDQLFNTNYGKGVSNEELMLQNGFVEIYDCGQATFVYDV